MPGLVKSKLRYSEIETFTPPPPKKNDRFWGGVNFFWEDPLGSSDHPSIIVGYLKVVWDLSKIFVGPPAGFRRLTDSQKVLNCLKMG